MDIQRYRFKQLDERAAIMIRELFVSVFAKEPWNDDWSDEKQLQLYIHDLVGQNNSLTFGLFEDDVLIGVSMGHIRHWYSGTEYFIDELCISGGKQGQGIGALFMGEIERACKELGLRHIFLLTENNVPAYAFYKRQNYQELEHNVAFAKDLL